MTAPAGGVGADPLFALADLAAGGERVAVIHGPPGRPESLSYEGLAARLSDFGRRLAAPSGVRRLVLVHGANRLESLVAHLAALSHGHVVLLVPADSDPADLVATYSPDLVVSADGRIEERHPESGHDLHPELALLLSTSGSTGSPKLVRLSADNVRSNARAIGGYLRLDERDRAITSLPLHYCYGLSVVHSHLAAGAGLVLTDLSVVDDCFWRLAREQAVTSFAGVPYTFDLLDHSGFADRELPRLRYVTQAGGRLAPERVRRYAEIGRRRGFDLFVMYGATEATARMAWLPPHLAGRHPDAIGLPIPGGSFDVDDGELVYTGPNVMLGYATCPGDLALGRTVTELRTGDRGEIRDGLVHVLGRLDRHVKVFGLRLDLDRLADRLEEAGVPAGQVHLHASGDRLWAFCPHGRYADQVGTILRDATGLPPAGCRVEIVDEIPRTPSGKPDQRALTRIAADRTGLPHEQGATDPVTAVRAAFAAVLGRPVAATDSFAGLGGDSLSYVELATRLEPLFGSGLPAHWQRLPIAELAAAAQPRPGPWSRIETSIGLRALAIVAIVASHVDLVNVMGGAHVLLAVVGFNVARFQLSAPTRQGRISALVTGLAVVSVPSMIWIALSGLVLDYNPSTVLLYHGFVADDVWTRHWQFWFLEALVWATVVTVALLAVPVVDRWERRHRFGFACGLLAGGLVARFAWAGLHAGEVERYELAGIGWLFALGWATALADTLPRRLIVTAAVLVGVPGFFGDPQRELIVVAGCAALIWLPTVRVPRILVPALGLLASASLFVYLTQWVVYPPLEAAGLPVLGLFASLAVGIGVWAAARPALRRLGRLVSTATAGEMRRTSLRHDRRRSESGRYSARHEPAEGPGRQSR